MLPKEVRPAIQFDHFDVVYTLSCNAYALTLTFHVLLLYPLESTGYKDICLETNSKNSNTSQERKSQIVKKH